ncbi:peptidyl-tRNA hydrolase 2, mitochondrial-like [Zingiber officinale]|uniref:peptidyl-tRNA hydrolase 2, mitochondrial-like n=1 Tax=Zingiber officinale TaxID=94328 RepID=UPI001C4BFC21|nr:peptidyl-tRNA hydrolase 2, mitochondrial-like [Zingiber officinale]
MAVPAFMTGISISLFSVFNALLIGAGCFALGFLLAQRETKGFFPFLYIWTKDLTNRKRAVDEAPNDPRNLNRVTVKKPTLEIENLAEIIEDFKMVLVVRNDLKMGKGKIAAQCSHATLGLYKKLLARAPKALSRWENCGQVKVVLKIESESDLLVLQGRAKSLKLPNHITIDAGRTQIAPNSMTVMAILGPSDLVDDVTGSLKLL